MVKYIFKIFFSMITLVLLIGIMLKKSKFYSIFSSKTTNNKTLIIYAYFEKNDLYQKTLEFFIENGVLESDQIDYLFVIQGGMCSANFPKYKNVIIYNRPNDCYDFGAYGKGINKLGGIEIVYNYKAVFFINPSAIGPFLPKYWPKEVHWTEIFLRKLNKNNVHAVGTSLYCLRKKEVLKKSDPRVFILGMLIVATPLAVQTAYTSNVFSCKKDKEDAVWTGEYGFSKAILENNMNIDSLLLKYGNIDWRNEKNWECNDYENPNWKNSYEGINVNPFEVVFHKPIWNNGKDYLPSIYLKETQLYMKWINSQNLNKTLNKN